MARPKEFNPDVAMQEAMEAFWERGYHATSVNDLLAEMKLNRGSLYGTFGDKKTLFLAALAQYEKQGREVVRQALERPGSARKAIEDWIRTVTGACTGEAGLRGCLALKAAMEMAPQDADVAEWVRVVTRDREQMVAKIIRKGQTEGEINPRLDPRAVARYFISCITGLKVLGTAAPSEREVREVVDLILRTLD
jgi:TetR/AcrR family transcriptional repressor of nem operon